MTNIAEYNRCGDRLGTLLKLATAPIAVKMLEQESDIPANALRPKKQRAYHLAQCQAFALSRRENTTVAMLKEDHWCPGPVMAYGLVPLPASPDARKNNPGDYFPFGKYIGVLTAPLKTANFVPDVVIVYSDTNQLRHLLLAMKQAERPAVSGHFFPFSCASAVVTPIIKKQYAVSLPDPGEYARALTAAGEMMFSIPAEKFCALVEDLAGYQSSGPEYAHETGMIMRPDFPQNDLYRKVFESWGMDHD